MIVKAIARTTQWLSPGGGRRLRFAADGSTAGGSILLDVSGSGKRKGAVHIMPVSLFRSTGKSTEQ